MNRAITNIKLVHQANPVPTGTVIFFHGSGDTGTGFHNWLEMLIGSVVFPHLKCIFPTAPLRNYTPNAGEPSHVWFDRYYIAPDAPEHLSSLDSINIEIKKLIQREVNNGTPLNRIVVGGFSMGGAMALHTAYRNITGLAGVFAMSSFLNDNSFVYDALIKNPEKAQTPMIIFHGDKDTLVDLNWGKETYEKLTTFGVDGRFEIVEDCYHEMKTLEIRDLFNWIYKILPEEPDRILQ